MWREYFTIVGCDKFTISGIGSFDALNENMPVEKLKKAYEAKFSNGAPKCTYIIPTKKGYETFYPERLKEVITISPLEIMKEIKLEVNKPLGRKRN